MFVRRRAAWVSAASIVIAVSLVTGCTTPPRPVAAPALAAATSAASAAPAAKAPAAKAPGSRKQRPTKPAGVRKPSPDAAATEARKQLAKTPALVRGSDRERYSVRTVVVDDDGSRHVRIDRTYRGLPVLGGDAVLHTGADGHSDGATVAQDRRIDVAVQPARTARQAEAAAVQAYPGTRRGAPAKLVVDALAGPPALAWEVEDRGGADGGYTEVVDARSGAVRRGVPMVRAAETGTGHGLHSGEVPLSTRRADGGGYELVDPDRGGSVTRDAQNRTDPDPDAAVVFTDDDNAWGDGTVTDRATVAVDVHYGVQQTWDYFAAQFGRRGIADDGRGAVALTHYGNRTNNAFWSDSCQCMAFGDGDGRTKAYTSLDVVAHELTHGITSATAGLAYWGESGGLDEATSDIFGTLVEFAAQNPADPADYLVGEQLDHDGVDNAPLRYMADPARDGRSRSCWTPDIGDVDVHYSSGVANKFFFMLAEGSGTSAYGVSPTCAGAPAVPGIGRDVAGAIWYRALTRYLVSNSNYAAARQATLRAAVDLHGADSPQYASVEAAWNAVGVDDSQQVPQNPYIKDPGSLKGLVGDEVRLQIEAGDPQGDPLTYTATELPDGLTMNAGGLITGVYTRGDRYFTQFTVTDPAGDATTVFELWEVNGPPVFYPERVQPHTNQVGDSVFDYFDVLDWEFPITWEITGLPDGVTHWDASDSWISGTVETPGVWEVTVTATDGTGLSASATFTWTVEAPPVN